jgi:ATP-dependent helicase HrpA
VSVSVDLRAQFEALREQLLSRHARQLQGVLSRAVHARHFDAGRFQADLARAHSLFKQRQAARPATIAYPEELPVTQARETLSAAIAAHRVIVVCGETGSGKTTQLPKLCLELGRGLHGLIGHTQPRRLAARTVAHRIAKELGGNVGELVAYETRFDRRVSARSAIKLMTDGILLAELQRDRDLLAYDTIIVDEAHERSLNIDFLLGWLKRLLPRRPDLKVIVTSATLDPEKLAAHFADANGQPAPILRVEGRTFPVEVRFAPPADDADTESLIADAIESLWREQRAGDTLIFLPGEREIRDTARVLAGRFPNAEVLPLYSRLAAQEQDRVFSGGGARPRLVLATNVAETSITVPGIRYVVDTGTARINRFAPRLGIQRLQIEPIAQAAANQRAGRCGRVGPGVCVRLYAEDDFTQRPPFTDPEIRRANLAGVILQMTALNLGDIEQFPWLDAPDGRQIGEGQRLLEMLGAITPQKALTPLGRELARLPLDPRVARIALAGRNQSWREPLWALAAALSVQDPHEVPPDAQDAARAKHAAWRHPKSDFLTLLNLWTQWQQWRIEHRQRSLRRVCREHFVSYLRMEEWEAVYKQIVDLLDDDKAPKTGLAIEAISAELHAALLAGLVDHVGVKKPQQKDQRATEYQGPRARLFRIFPGSVLVKKPPQWLVAAQLAQTSQLFARTCAAIEPELIVHAAPHLVKSSLADPHWEMRRGEVVATEHLTLFGLPLLSRARHYGSDNPREAREIFIREALVAGALAAKPLPEFAFLQRNLALIEDVRDKEARLRRPDLLADEVHFAQFYDAVLPQDVFTTAGLRAWLRRERDAGQRLTMRDDDALKAGASADIASLFPDHLDVGSHRIELSYEHDPGADADGVSFHLPIAGLFAVPASLFDWLVPGLAAAKIEALIRTLPMHLRRQCTPAAEYANAIAASTSSEDGALLDAICARFAAMTGVSLRPADFAPDKLEAHLKPRIVLEGPDGKTLGEAETLADLQTRFGGIARAALTAQAVADPAAKRWTRDGVPDWDFGTLPDHVDLAAGRGYPALVADTDGRINLRLLESRAAADAAHTAGTQALLLARVSDRLRDLARHAKSRLGIALAQTGLNAEQLARAAAERAARAYWNPTEIRDEAGFRAALERRGEFGRAATQRLDDVIGWLLAALELRRRIEAIEKTWPDAAADLREQLRTLFAPGFIADIPEAQWPRIVLYLKAASIRLDRLPQKPARDLDFTKTLRGFWRSPTSPFHAARWILEEWRIATFAQELKALGAPSVEKVRAALVGGR